MGLNPTTTTFVAAENQTWLGSAFGVSDADSITLDSTLCIAKYATGLVPSGLVVGKVTATGRYGPYDNAASDGREVAAGLLLTTKNIGTGSNAQNTPAALLWHGEVIQANLPEQSGTGSIDSAGKVDLASHVKWV